MFDSNRKKTFHSQALNWLTVLERLTWLIPVGFIVREIIYTHSEIEEVLHDSPSPAVIIALIIAILFVTALQAGFWFLLAKVLFHFARKQIMRNNSFITVEDLDYYRDKLTGLSPGTISLLTDLKIEPKKDRAACILKYENMGILKMEEKRYIVNTDVPEFASLRESDRFLLNALCNGTFNAQKEGNWIYMLQKEAVADGYLTSRLSSTDKQKETTSTCSRCVLGCSAPLFFIVIMSFVFYAFKDRVNAYFEILNALPETASFGEQTNYLLQYPEYLPVLAGLMIMVLLFFLCLIIPLLVFVGTISSGFTKAHFKRTTLGNQMTEYIYGMKNFIHDFSNLSEATQNELVLWDDYLVYAVVLEENQQIVNDIIKRRKSL